MASDWVKYPTVLKELNVARSTMEDWRRTGKAPKFHKMPSGRLRIPREELDAWVESLELV
jgi:predicted site-specific integrase-resolvase